MRKALVLGVQDPADDYLAALPPNQARHFANRLGENIYFEFDEPDFPTLIEMRRAAKQAGREILGSSLFDPEERPREHRVYKAFCNVNVRGARFHWNGYRVERRCEACGKTFEEIDERAQPRLTLPDGERPPILGTDGAFLLSESLVLEATPHALLRGARLIDVGQRYHLLQSSIELGLETWDDSVERCHACGRLRVSPGFFPLYPVAPPADVYFNRDYSPATPILSGRLARALEGDTPDELTLWFSGWYPEDLELARIPSLD